MRITVFHWFLQLFARKEFMNKVEEFKAEEFKKEMVDSFTQLLESQIRRLGLHDAEKEKIAKKGLIEAYISMAQAHVPHGNQNAAVADYAKAISRLEQMFDEVSRIR
jgi:hypothetical protein